MDMTLRGWACDSTYILLDRELSTLDAAEINDSEAKRRINPLPPLGIVFRMLVWTVLSYAAA